MNRKSHEKKLKNLREMINKGIIKNFPEASYNPDDLILENESQLNLEKREKNIDKEFHINRPKTAQERPIKIMVYFYYTKHFRMTKKKKQNLKPGLNLNSLKIEYNKSKNKSKRKKNKFYYRKNQKKSNKQCKKDLNRRKNRRGRHPRNNNNLRMIAPKFWKIKYRKQNIKKLKSLN